MEGKVLVDTAQAGDEMILPRADCTFSRVAAMGARDDELVVNVLCNEKLFEKVGTFVVKALEGRAKSSLA